MFTEEQLLKKFNGDVQRATLFMELFLEYEEARFKELEKCFRPGSEYWKSIDAEIDRSWEFTFLPLWKKALIKLKLIKR